MGYKTHNNLCLVLFYNFKSEALEKGSQCTFSDFGYVRQRLIFQSLKSKILKKADKKFGKTGCFHCMADMAGREVHYTNHNPPDAEASLTSSIKAKYTCLCGPLDLTDDIQIGQHLAATCRP